MTRRNAPLTRTDRLRVLLRHLNDGIPKAHVATEFRLSRPTMTTWATRYLESGEAGLTDRSFRPHSSHISAPEPVVKLIKILRHRHKCRALCIHRHLIECGVAISLRTASR